MPLSLQYFTISTHSRRLSECENPTEDMASFFHKVEIIHTTRGQKKEEIIFFYGKMASLKWNPNRGRWVEGIAFLTIS